MVDHRTDYYRAANALDLVDWLASQTSDTAMLERYIDRITMTLEKVSTHLEEARRNG